MPERSLARDRSTLQVVWEQINDPEAGYYVRRAIELILADRQAEWEPGFDRCSAERHDEEVPAENNQTIQPK
jgi:hypothetical protein